MLRSPEFAAIHPRGGRSDGPCVSPAAGSEQEMHIPALAKAAKGAVRS